MHVKNYLLAALFALASIHSVQAAPFELSTGALLHIQHRDERAAQSPKAEVVELI